MTGGHESPFLGVFPILVRGVDDGSHLTAQFWHRKLPPRVVGVGQHQEVVLFLGGVDG